ncbi:MAG: hypothetical protein ACJ79O_03705 [Myxococcales bacterium]
MSLPIDPALAGAAATLAAAIIGRVPGGTEVSTDAIGAAYLQALEAIEDAMDKYRSGNWREHPRESGGRGGR